MSISHSGLPATVPSEQEAALSYKLSTNAASLCGAIVKSTAISIQGRKYVRSEGWLAIAMAHGCVVSVRSVERVEGGICAIAELRRMSDQALIATAEGFVGDDEPTWAKRPMFARRAMAQTRASSRVCRTVFAHVVIMVDRDLGTTPAEEMQGVVDYEPIGPGAVPKVDPADQALVKNGDNRSTYQQRTAEKAPGRLAAELWASQAVGLFRMPDYDLLHYREWKETPCTPGGRKSNGEKLEELREKHPDLAQAIDDVVADLEPAVLGAA